MGLFDNLNDKEKPENKNNKKRSMKEEFEQRKKDIKTGMSIRNGVLNRVYINGITDGVFVVPEEVEAIAMYAFSRLQNLKTVIMHENIKRIDQGAFQSCVNLSEVKGLEHANRLQKISGFEACKSLKKITLPDSVENIGFEAFLDCKNLSEINLPSSCWCVSKRAFAGCENLKTVQIPASMEVIDEEAFAGCSNATLVFLEDDKKLMADFAKEQKAINMELYCEDLEEEEYYADEYEEEKTPLSLEERIQMFEDFNIKYRIINIGGEKFLWPVTPLSAKENAFAGVKEIIALNESKIETAIKSGYKGKVSIANLDNDEVFSVDLKTLDYIEQAKKANIRAKYYSQFLIPSGGTTNWIINCDKNNYNGEGYAGTLVWKQQLSDDASITVCDFKQPKRNVYKYTQEEDEFFTSVTFTKKELTEDKNNKKTEIDRAYEIYFPYGARFNTELLSQIGLSLNILIDTARDLPDTNENKAQLQLIEQKQKQIIELFFKGTKDKDIVAKIMDDKSLMLLVPDGKIRVAKHKKDWLPYFNDSLFMKFKEAREYNHKDDDFDSFFSKN